MGSESSEHIPCAGGSNDDFNVSASDETTGKDVYRKELVNSQSARLICGYVYAGAGEGESTTDLVFPGHNLICENGGLPALNPGVLKQALFTAMWIWGVF